MSDIGSQIGQWREAIGRSQTRRQLLDVESLRRFAVAIGADPDVERSLPPLAHWAWFLDAPEDEGIGPDGHPRRGGFIPAIMLPRRMFASASLRFGPSIELGAEAELRSEIVDVRHRSGASGDLVFVDVERRLGQFGVERVSERQTLVYREAGDAVMLPTPSCSEPEAPDGELWTPNEVNLFRFSAATFNGHRIHYDHPYTTAAEGYPALVVHGPFSAARLALLASQAGPLAGLDFKLQAPLFLGQPIRLERVGGAEFRAVRCDGVASTILKATYR